MDIIQKDVFQAPNSVARDNMGVCSPTIRDTQVSSESSRSCLLQKSSLVLGLFAFESKTALLTRFDGVYQALVCIVWINTSLVSIYALGILLLALLTQFSCDQDIWSRDIDSSPAPFPLDVVLVYILPMTARYFRGSPDPSVTTHTSQYCLEGCICSSKMPEAPNSEASSTEASSTTNTQPIKYSGSTRPHIPIRVPTAMERRNLISVSLEGFPPVSVHP